MGGASDDFDFDPDRPTKGEPVQYEYQVYTTTVDAPEDLREKLGGKDGILNILSAEGWEVMQIDNSCHSDPVQPSGLRFDCIVIFRRPKRPVEGPKRIPGVIYD